MRFNVGDKVKVVRKIYEQRDWMSEMDLFVGDGNLHEIYTSGVLSVRIQTNPSDNRDPERWHIDVGALELVSRNPIAAQEEEE